MAAHHPIFGLPSSHPLFHLPRSGNDGDVFGVGGYLQNVFGEPLYFVICADKSSILVEVRTAQMTGIEAVVKNGNIGKKTVPKFGDKSSSWAANGHNQIRLPLGTT